MWIFQVIFFYNLSQFTPNQHFHLPKELLRPVEVSHNDRPKQSVDARHILPGISISDIETETLLQSKVI